MQASTVGVSRLTIRPFTFSNGMTIPAGTLISLPLRAVHTDGEIYPSPEKFDGFRFLKLREREGDTAVAKHQTVSTSSEHLPFGLGRHAWCVAPVFFSFSLIQCHFLTPLSQPWAVLGGRRDEGFARPYHCNV
jgi:hypothetical protein